jgi:oligo-1,6-glucosidase
VITNFSGKNPVFRLPDDITYKTKELLISNYDVDEAEELKEIRLHPWEARVYKIRLS